MPGTALDSALQRETVSTGAVPFAPALAALLAAFSAVYLPSVGHGFLKDDFGWILRRPLNSLQDAAAFWRGAPSGFFRPLISLSFGVNRWGCGLQSRCYGLSNLVLLLACAAAIFVLVRGLELSKGTALLASALWVFNWHTASTCRRCGSAPEPLCCWCYSRCWPPEHSCEDGSGLPPFCPWRPCSRRKKGSSFPSSVLPRTRY